MSERQDVIDTMQYHTDMIFHFPFFDGKAQLIYRNPETTFKRENMMVEAQTNITSQFGLSQSYGEMRFMQEICFRCQHSYFKFAPAVWIYLESI